MCTKNGSYCEKEKKVSGGGGRGGVRVDVNGEVAFVKIQKKYIFFGGGGGGVRVRGGGQGGCELRSEAFLNIPKNIGGSGRGGGCGVGLGGGSGWM